MKKSRLATLLLSMTLSAALVVPAMAGTPAEGDALAPGGSIYNNAGVADTSEFENEGPVLSYTEMPEVLNFYGSAERFNEMSDTVSADRFKEVYKAAADRLESKVDKTSDATAVTSTAQCVSEYFTNIPDIVGITPYYSFNSKAVTEYVESGYCHLMLEPMALMQELLSRSGVETTIYMVVGDTSYAGTVFVLECVTDTSVLYIIPSSSTVDKHFVYTIQNTPPVGMYSQPFRDMYMGQMKDYIK